MGHFLIGDRKMALKKVLTSLDGLSDALKGEYKQVGDEFHLDVEGDDTAAKLAQIAEKKRIAEEHRVKAERERDEAKEKLDEMRRGAIPKDDVQALEQSWKEKVEAANKAKQDAENSLMGEIMAITAGAAARQIASEISNAPDLMEPVIRKRLTTEVVDGVRVVRVKDANGKPSAMSIDDLKAEIKADARYATVIIAGKGSGGGAGGNGGGGNGGGGAGTKKLSEMSEADRIEFAKRDPDGFRRAMAGS